MILNAISSNTRTHLERRLEAFLAADSTLDDSTSEADRLEAVPFTTICALLKKGSILEQYPARPSKIDLRAKGGEPTSVNATTLSPEAPAFHSIFSSCNPVAATSAATSATTTTPESLPTPTRPSIATTSSTTTPTSWNKFLTIAATSIPSKFAEDPMAALAGLAQLLEDSRQAAHAAADTVRASLCSTIAIDLAKRLTAIPALHPSIQSAATDLLPRRGVRRDYPA